MADLKSDKMTYDVPAKINLFLDITGKRADGYHLVRMLMQTVSLYDTLSVERTDGPDSMTCSVPGLKTDESNLCRKALSAMKEHFSLQGNYRIHLIKRIPMAAGLAGGSADAAAVMRCLEALEHLECDGHELEEIAVQLGADVPYCLTGGAMLSEGIGEILTRVRGIPEVPVVLAKPPVAVITKEVYAAYDHCGIIHHPDTEKLLNKAMDGQMEYFAQYMKNVLEQVTAPRYPVIRELEEALRKYGSYGAMMSGSGPTVFGLFRSQERADAAAEQLRTRYPGFEIFSLHFTKETWK